MTTAAPYQLFAPLKPDEYSALKADIQDRGVLVPVEVDEHGTILDGHHRVQIADELGIEYPTIKREGWSVREKRRHVLKLNLARRHLAPHDWGQAFLMLLEERGVKRGRGSRNDLTSAKFAEVASEN